MRLAILSDIHGNLPAFEAALEHLARQQVDQLVIAGDIVNGAPDSRRCYELARSLHCPILRGNHERYVAHFGGPHASPHWGTEQFAPLRWTVAQLSAEQREQLGALPLSYRPPDSPGLLIVHASARSDYDQVLAYTPDEQLEEMFCGVEEQLIVRAHAHLPQVRLWGRRRILTTGSVGLSLDGNPQAQYLILEQRRDGWHATHHAVPYDLDAVARRFYDTGYLEATGPIGRLFLREVMTATFQIVPFLRAYERWSAHEPISLSEALERFLRM
ncbi:MAG: metallophosphoesterase [Herpetosiphonaceae bacterium]|nr:MAG: metallophosphoesterase [Herpetosiphonaceae bacterium]